MTLQRWICLTQLKIRGQDFLPCRQRDIVLPQELQDQGTILAVGGRVNEPREERTVELLDMDSMQWITMASMTRERSSHGAMVIAQTLERGLPSWNAEQRGVHSALLYEYHTR